LGNRVDGFVLAHVFLLAHVGVYHEVRRVGLDNCCSGGFADNMRLWKISAFVQKEVNIYVTIARPTISAPSLADAMAEK
jgi:hypothetical protein